MRYLRRSMFRVSMLGIFTVVATLVAGVVGAGVISSGGAPLQSNRANNQVAIRAALSGTTGRGRATWHRTRSGEFRAAFPGAPTTSVLANPYQIFPALQRWTTGVVSSVAYQPTAHRSVTSSWSTTVELVRLKSAAEARVVRELVRRFQCRFEPIGGAEVGPGPSFSPSSKSWGTYYSEIVVTKKALYVVIATGPTLRASQAFVGSLSAPGFAGAALAPLSDFAEVTGYKSVSPSRGSSNPVSVRVGISEAAGLANIINQLPTTTRMPCQNASLLYRVDFRSSPTAPPEYEVEGYDCEATLLITVDGRTAAPRRDTACQLIGPIRRLLPAAATGTQKSLVGCHV